MADNVVQQAIDAADDEAQIVSFVVGQELFGVGIDRVKEIVRYPDITSVPRAPDYLTGLANLRGKVLPVIDSRTRLSLPQSDISDNSRVLVLDTGSVQTGVIVDAVRGVINTEGLSVEPPPEIVSSGVDTRFVESVFKLDGDAKMVMKLDIDVLCDVQIDKVSSSSAAGGPARQEEQAAAGINEIQLVTFLVAHEEYGFPIESVREILRVGRVTEVPDAPPYVMGIYSVRNSLLPIVDIRKLFGISSLAEEMSDDLVRMERSHQHWLEALGQDLDNAASFNGVIDPASCDLGRWLENFRTSSEQIGRALQDLRLVHQNLHGLANGVQDTRRLESKSAAQELYQHQAPHLREQFSGKMDALKADLGNNLDEDQRILVIEVGRMPVGILVDRMQQVIRVPENIIDPAPAILSTDRAENLRGIVKLEEGKRLILLLHEDKVLSSERQKELESMETAAEKRIDSGRKEIVQDDEIQLVTFRLGSEEYGLGIDAVQEINRLEQITAVPRAPAFVEGVMNLRGNVIPAIDLRKRFGLEVLEHDEQTRVIIVNLGGKLTGFIVDSVSEVLRLTRRSIEPPPEVIACDLQTEFILGIGKVEEQGRMILLLDTAKMLTLEEQKQLKMAGPAGGEPVPTRCSAAAGNVSPEDADDPQSSAREERPSRSRKTKKKNS